MRDLSELKSHLEDIESELKELTIKPRVPRPGRQPKITKEGFLKAQVSAESATSSGEGGGKDYIMDLIAKPSRRRPSCDSRAASRPRPPPPPSSSSASVDSEPLVPRRTPVAPHVDSTLQLELFEQKRKLGQEYERRVALLQKNIEELRQKRVCDKETYRDELAKYERDVAALKAANQSLEDINLRATHDLEAAEARVRDYKQEVEKLQRDLDRMDQRCGKSGQAVIEMEGKLRGEKQAFDTRVMQLESQLGDQREAVTKLRLREEQLQQQLQVVAGENQELKQTISAERTVQEKLQDDLARMQKKMESEIEGWEQLKAAYDLRMHEISVELQAERDRLTGVQQALRVSEQKEAAQQARLYEKEKDSRELAALRELHQTVSSERLMLQTQIRAISDECERQRAQLQMATQAQHAAQIRAEDAENECQRLRRKVEALQVQCSKSIVTNAAQRLRTDSGDTLTDADGAPISRLRSAQQRPLTNVARPVWWFEGGTDETATVIRRTAAVPSSSSTPAGEGSIVIPAPRSASVSESPADSGLQVLKSQRRNIMRELAMMPPSRNYRTSAENDLWDELQQRKSQIEADIRTLEV